VATTSKVTWTPPPTGGSVILDYLATTFVDDVATSVVLPAAATSYIVTLTTGTPTTFYLQARNILGLSSPASVTLPAGDGIPVIADEGSFSLNGYTTDFNTDGPLSTNWIRLDGADAAKSGGFQFAALGSDSYMGAKLMRNAGLAGKNYSVEATMGPGWESSGLIVRYESSTRFWFLRGNRFGSRYDAGAEYVVFGIPVSEGKLVRIDVTPTSMAIYVDNQLYQTVTNDLYADTEIGWVGVTGDNTRVPSFGYFGYFLTDNSGGGGGDTAS
jgi:hypothetical protein